jgi:hypothetical protein
MARRWRLNPPPNWPTLPEDWEPDHDWSPDPGWGPAPVGWTLWHRERRAAWLLRHRRSAGLGSAVALTLLVALAGPPSSGTLTEAAPAVPAEADAVPPASGVRLVPRTPPDRPQTEPAIRLERREPSASRSRRAEPRPAVAGSPAAPTPTAGRVPSRSPNSGAGEPEQGTGSETGGASGPSACRTPLPPPGGPQEPPPTGTDRIITVGFTRGSCPSGVRRPGGFPSPAPTSSGSPEDPG